MVGELHDDAAGCAARAKAWGTPHRSAPAGCLTSESAHFFRVRPSPGSTAGWRFLAGQVGTAERDSVFGTV